MLELECGDFSWKGDEKCADAPVAESTGGDFTYLTS
jgi:hypothetical protein